MIKISENIQLKEILNSDSELLFRLMKEIYTPAYQHFWIDQGAWYINSQYSKENVLQNISNSDADSWGENSLGYEIREVVSDLSKRIVYVKTWNKFLDDVSGLEAEALTLTRFEFNQSGMVLSVGNMTENELILRQTGWSITK